MDDDASVEPQRRSFSDATCNRLSQLILNGAALAVDATNPQWLNDEIQELRLKDAAFDQWLDRCLPEKTHRQIHRITRQLLLDQLWFSDDLPRAEAARRLLDTAALVERLRSLERNFASELDSCLQRSLYNFAYGLSHELNNPLANIATRAGVLAQDEPRKQRLHLLRAIVNNAMRGCEMLGDLMLLARPPAMMQSMVTLGDLLDQIAERTLRWVDDRSIEVCVTHHGAVQVMLDPAMISEALWAVIRNSVEAMPTGGRLTICTSAFPDKSNDTTETRAECWGRIEITDEGCGLSAAALASCFDPYFSGREAGRGLGLGLSKARRLVSLHAGRISISNRQNGTGCRVVIDLPVGGLSTTGE